MPKREPSPIHYWWNTASLDLNAVSGGTLTGDLTNRTELTNLCGQSASDTTAHPGPNCGSSSITIRRI